ncbi:MAG: rhodanese-like domain-containing protein [Acidimicrobiia bacterium]|nr:rhodanese-like domain-containing protein [Acidimicrobiia bacterium]
MNESIPSITVGDVDELDRPVFLDVRERNEYDAGHAPGVTWHALGTLEAVVATLPTSQTILCICRSGARSGRATEFLRSQGIDAVNLEGGMQAWAAFGFDVVCDDGSDGTVI